MKKMCLFFSLSVSLLLVAVAVNATGIHRGFDKCQITSVDDLFVGKKIQKVWSLNYNPNEASVTVLKRKTGSGFEYLVRSAYFEVCYSWSDEGFGVKKMKPASCNIPTRITKAVIDPKEMEHQRILTPNKVDDETAIGLIASYLPDLLNDSYTHLLN
jgi:hypothetical protein